MDTIYAHEFNEMGQREFASLFNAISGAKPAFLVGSGMGADENLAVFNSITHIGSNPPLLGFIQRPTSVERNTYNNIKIYKQYSFNLVTESFYKQAHQTSARYDKGTSEFDQTGLTAEYKDGSKCPFVSESPLHITLELTDDIEIKSNNTRLIIGKVLSISKSKSGHKGENSLDFEALKGINVSGLSEYYKLTKIASLPYAKTY